MQILISLSIISISMVLTKLYCRLATNTSLMDNPNSRSSHVTPTVRGGGLVFIGLSLLFLPLIAYHQSFSYNETVVLFSGIVLVAGVSFLDDFYHLSAQPRLIVQLLAACMFTLYFLPAQLDLGVLSIHNPLLVASFLIIILLWGINHFNFMDGIDGLCASQAIFLLLSYAFLFHRQDAAFYEYFCFILTLNIIGFLVYNFPPAKLFMGDVGSATLGFISISLAAVGQARYDIPLLYWFILNSLFLFDSSMTLIRRILNHEEWASPHRKHAYQRLKLLGVNNRLILLGQLFINSLMFLLVLLFEQWPISVFILIGLSLLPLALVYLIIEKQYPMHLEPKV